MNEAPTPGAPAAAPTKGTRRAALVSSARVAAGLLALVVMPLLLFHELTGAALTNPLGLALFGFAGPVLLLALLRRQRAVKPVSALVFWLAVERDLEASRPFQRLRRHLLLLLQLLLLALFAYAAAGPVLTLSSERARAIALILDASGSMQARDVAGATRFEAARAKAEDLVRSMGRDDRMMIIVAGAWATIQQPWTGRPELLLRALARCTPGDTASALEDALLLAAGALRSLGSEGELVVLGDGAGGRELPALELARAPTFLRFGTSADNIAITRALLDLEDEQHGGRIFATIEAFGAKEFSAVLILSRAGRPLDARAIKLAGGARRALTFRLPEGDPGPLELRLQADPPDAPLDALSEDDRAIVLVPEIRRHVVLTYGALPGALERALLADPRVQLGGWPPKLNADQAPTRAAALAIVVGALPEPLPDLPTLFIAPERGIGEVSLGAELPEGVISGWDRDHPTLRFVDPQDVAIRRSRALLLGGGARSLLEVNGQSVAAALRIGTREHIVLGFALEDTNWPMRLSFPVFVRNLISTRGPTLGHAELSQAGAVVAIAAPEGQVVVRTPRGELRSIAGRAGTAYFSETEVAGLYEVRSGEERSAFIVPFADAAESAIAPRPELKIGRSATDAGTERLRRDVQDPFLALALLLLLAEYGAWKNRL